MKKPFVLLPALFLFLMACHHLENRFIDPPVPIKGTWQLVTGITITKGDSVVTDYTKNQQMIKIITGTHFAFLKHDINTPKDSSLHFDAGGGKYSLVGDQYTEHLDFYNDKNWEGKTFTFTVSVTNDTLVQKGIEKVEGAGVDRVIVEKYVKVRE